MTLAPVATYASNRLQATVAESHGGRIVDAYVYRDPGEAEYRAKRAMHSATRSIATVASAYASHVPFPASANTRGIVAAGVVVGAMVETDCARVSRGERIPFRNPQAAVWGGSDGVGSMG